MQQVKPKDPAPKPKEQFFVRMAPHIYNQLERKLPAPVVSQQTTDLQAGFQLGVQYVLKQLRDGYVIEGN